ncbi:MAG: peptide chain release factor N(5)-glutamine methyltransferase [bacterium]|nr:peptide chain release factor N(5)-glutamine methyltransferase [bacterium]
MLISELLKKSIKNLQDGGIENPVLDAELLIAYVLGMERYQLVTQREKEVVGVDIHKIEELLKRRLNFEPLFYIIGTKEFYSLEFEVNKHVLIPRPETEMLVDLAVKETKKNGTLLDLGTGSGIIAVSIKHNRPDLEVIAADISVKALDVARKNAERLIGRDSILFYSGDLFAPFEAMKTAVFDVIVSNPPYIDPGIKETLQKELNFEPAGALFSEENGRKITKNIIHQAENYLVENGTLLLETGADMKDFIIKTGEECGYRVSILNDYAGLPRVGVLKRNGYIA